VRVRSSVPWRPRAAARLVTGLGTVLVAGLLAACGGTAAGTPPASTATPAVTGSVATGSSAPGDPVRYPTASQLSDAVVAAVRAKGSVLVTTTAAGVAIVSRRSVQLVGGRQDEASVVSIPNQPDATLLVVDDVPYVSTAEDPAGPRWLRLGFDDLAASRTWSAAAYAVDLPTELAAWRLATAVRGGEVTGPPGERVRTYTLTLGPAAAAGQVRLDRVPAADRATVSDRLARMQFDVTVVLGRDDLPRTITSIAPASGLVTTQTYSRWGQVTVSAPAPQDVVADGGAG
jgi:hypothetical protein